MPLISVFSNRFRPIGGGIAPSAGTATDESGFLSTENGDSLTNENGIYIDIDGTQNITPSQTSPINLILNLNGTTYVSGTTWFDLTSYNNNGLINGATFSSDYGGVFNFNGTSDYISIGQPLIDNSSYTINVWVKAIDLSGHARNIVSTHFGPFWINNGTLYGGVGGTYTNVSSPSFPENQWKFVSLTFNDSTNTMKLYINGVLVDINSSVNASYISEPTFIGSHYSTQNVSFYKGLIGEVTIYNDSLSDSVILLNFNNTKSRYV